MSRSGDLFRFAAACLLVFVSNLACADSGFTFTNEPGPHAVGLRVVQQYDHSRSYKGNIDSVPGERARPIQTLIWYPARPGGQAMRYGDYAALMASEDNFDPAHKNEGAFGKRAREIKAVSGQPMRATRDPAPEDGKFPLVIYAPSFGASAIENADLCEYVASQGYVVMASASMGAQSRPMTGDLEGVETQVGDIEFLIDYARTLPQVDFDKIAVVGFSWGGLANVAAAAKDPRIRALISLDGTIRYDNDTVKAISYLTPSKIDIPYLYVASRPASLEQMNIDKKYYDISRNFLNELIYSDVYIASMAAMAHEDFSSYFLRVLPDTSFSEGYTRQEATVAHNAVARYVERFLDAYLKTDAAALAFLGKAPEENGVPRHFMRMISRKAEPEAQITADDMLKHIKVLSSDEFEGRAPGSRGEQLSVAYIQNEFKRLGLEPGAQDGSYVQPVPMMGITSTPSMTLTVGGKSTTLKFSDDYVAWSARPNAKTVVKASDLVFVGYGVTAPEYGWDDYKGVDLRGKTLVMLINDPAIPDPADPSKLDPRMFKGSEMTYYGRWTYKFEMAAKLGAAAAIIVHETAAAGYPFDVVRHTWAHENLALESTAKRHPPVSAWIQQERAKELFKSAGFDFEALKQQALSKDFKPVDLGIKASFEVSNQINKVESRNVIAKIIGSDPALRDEAVVYTAHWDHLGTDPTLPGPRTRQIYHGALDNAAGVAALFNIARAYQILPVKPKRTLIFIATTAEEQGLLGAQYYVGHPVIPLDKTLLDINIDVINAYGRTSDLRIIGDGKSDMDELVVREAAAQGRTALPDASPELGSFFRADQFEFAKAGVPVLFLKAGTQVLGKPASYGSDKKREYVAHHYHRVDDVIDEQWDLSGAVEDMQLLFRVGLDVAQGAKRPQWQPNSEFQRPPASDPYLWLEEVDSPKATSWVRAENAKTLSVLQADPRYATFHAQALAIAQAHDRIPFAHRIDGGLWNFWQDAEHVHGIWRVASPESYDAGGAPAWKTVLDLDKLAATEHANWVWKGAQCEATHEYKCLVALSNGGEDAATIREFDLRKQRFVSGGFELPRSKQSAVWEGTDALIVAREWLPGELTKSGYPYVIKRLQRGQPLSAAVEVFRGSATDARLKVRSFSDSQGHQAIVIQRGLTFFEWQTSLLTSSGIKTLKLPAKASVVALFDGQLIVKLDEAWPAAGPQFTQGTLAAVDLSQALANPEVLHPTLVFAPTERQSLEDVASTQTGLLVTLLDNVRGRASLFTRSHDGAWHVAPIALPDDTAVTISDTSAHSATAYLSVSGYLQPESQWRVDGSAAKVLRSLPAQFDASHLAVEQFEATSSDGVQIPYTVVHPKGMALDGSHPTILHAYGGFAISETPSYSGAVGKLWLERGGVYVVANIRGGGEFGPRWHEAGLKTKRQIIYDDFAAVGRDLIARGITSARRLGIMGGSNGGLLMGVEMTQHPELWSAVDIEVPLLDMLRFEQIAAGALWVGEYGSVSNADERAFLAKISPYENLRRDVKYPQALVWTTAKDDRVGPQHARKFAARLSEYGIPYYFYEFTEGGHSADANLQDLARTDAMEFVYFARQLMDR